MVPARGAFPAEQRPPQTTAKPMTLGTLQYTSSFGGGAVVRVAVDHDGVVPRRPSEGTTVADMVLDVADDGALEDPVER